MSDINDFGIPGLTDEERDRLMTAIRGAELMGTITRLEDQDTLVLTLGDSQVSTLDRSLRSTRDEVGAWLAEAYITSQARLAGLSENDIADEMRRAARHLSAWADRVEGDWG